VRQLPSSANSFTSIFWLSANLLIGCVNGKLECSLEWIIASEKFVKASASNEGRWQNYGWRVMSGEGKFVVGAVDSRFSEVLGNG